MPEEFQLNIGGFGGGDENESWALPFVWSRAGTIYAGSSQIQKNILGERVLGLPKEVRADRMPAAPKTPAAAATGDGAE